jgi:hypothetical protein
MRTSMYKNPTTIRYAADKKWYFNRFVPAVLPHVTNYLADVFKHDKELLMTYGTEEIVICLATENGTHTHGLNRLRENPAYFQCLNLNQPQGHWFIVRRRGPVTETTPDYIWNLINERS